MSAPEFNDGSTFDPNEIYDQNIALVDSLDHMKERDSRFRRREKLWRQGTFAFILAPLVAVGVITATEHKMDFGAKAAAGVYGIFASAACGLVASELRTKSIEKAHDHAISAVPLSLELNNTVQPWIARRLAEKEEMERKRATNRA